MNLPNVMFRTALAIAALLLVTGCINRSSATMAPGQNLDQAMKYYVVKLGPDERGINKIISDRLILRGYQASTGLDIDTPEGTDVVVTYEDRWQWDMTMYMIELTVKFRDPKTQLPIASGNSYHTSLTRLSPAEMVDEVLDSIFAEAKK